MHFDETDPKDLPQRVRAFSPGQSINVKPCPDAATRQLLGDLVDQRIVANQGAAHVNEGMSELA